MRRRGLIRVLLLFGLVGLVLGVLSAVGPGARAAEQPRTLCGSTVVWGAGVSLRTPAEFPDAIAAAYEQVRPVAEVTARPGQDDTVRWHTIDRGTGDRRTPGDRETTPLLGDRVIWEHAHTPDEFADPERMRAVVLADVLRDLGVTEPTSTAVLSDADRAALEEICAAQATTAAPSAAAMSSPAAEDVPTTNTTSHETGQRGDTEAAAPPAAKITGLILLAVIGVGLAAAWVPLSPITAHGRGLVNRLRHRDSPDTGRIS